MKEAVLFKFSRPRNDPEKVRVWRVGGGVVVLGGSPSLFFIQSNLSTMATLGTEESSRSGEVAVMGRLGCNMTIFFREYNMFVELSSCLLYPIMYL